MEIKKLFQGDAVRTQESVKQNRAAAAYQEQGSRNVGKKGEDRVSISALSRQLSQISKVLTEDETERQARVQELKQQVTAGTYGVERGAVARSVVSYAADNENII